MRYISFDELYVPPEWDEYVQELLKDLSNCKTYKDRSKLIGKYPHDLWLVMRESFNRLSHGKCFYTEYRVEGALPDLDHFRPKSRVTKRDLEKGETHEGYWWLAFSIENFRLCAQDANRFSKDKYARKTYGKGTRFPLQKGSRRANTKRHRWKNELPLLLDPTVQNDVELLRFNDDGVVESANRDKSSVDYQRVDASIDSYRLNVGTIALRRGRICRDAKRLVGKLDWLENRKIVNGYWNRDELRDVIAVKLDLHRMVQADAEFSAAVRCVLRSYEFIQFIREILED